MQCYPLIISYIGLSELCRSQPNSVFPIFPRDDIEKFLPCRLLYQRSPTTSICPLTVDTIYPLRDPWAIDNPDVVKTSLKFRICAKFSGSSQGLVMAMTKAVHITYLLLHCFGKLIRIANATIAIAELYHPMQRTMKG